MNKRELLIQNVGIHAADRIMDLERQIEELYEFLKVVRVAHTTGFKLLNNPALGDK